MTIIKRNSSLPVPAFTHSGLFRLAGLTAILLFHTAAAPAQVNSFIASANNDVFALALQPDGKILVGGNFTTLDGQNRLYLGRVNPDGTLDAAFNPGPNNSVYSLALQPDGKILVGGAFASLAGQTRQSIGRLNSDGTLDATFNPGATNNVYCLALQPDGKIVVGGSFTTLGGQSHNYVGRLATNGTLETTFNPVPNNPVNSVVVQPDGKMVLGGAFSFLSLQRHFFLGRLNSDGSLDTNYTAVANAAVNCLALQPDGKIVVGGSFTTLDGIACTNLGRLNTDGTFDAAFNSAGVGAVYSLAVRTDGSILAGGSSTNSAGQPRNSLVLLNADGSIAATLNQSSAVFAQAIQSDGQIVIGGDFSNYLARLPANGAATQNLTFDGSTVTWLRGGSSAEVWLTTFDSSPDGTTWTNLGTGTRIAGGWQLTGLSVPTTNYIRARGYTSGAYQNGSGWFLESIFGAPLVMLSPVSRTNNAGTAATFVGSGEGSGPLAYQWLKNGQALTDSGNVAGSLTPALTLTNVLAADEGGYSLLISNSLGTVTSLVATLTVVDPLLTNQPVSLSRNGGDNATFTVGVYGTQPLSYQWRKSQSPLNGATNSSLTLTNLQGSDAASYDVVVTNNHGSLTSAVAVLSINLTTVDTFGGSASGTVYALALQADSRILVGGTAGALSGQFRAGIGRLETDGTLDASFNPQAGVNAFYALAVQPDGKIVAAGTFSSLGGQSRTNIGRLNSNGTLDSAFNPGAVGGSPVINCLALQADGKIIVGGGFSILGGQARSFLGRLNTNGTLDTAFNPTPNNTVLTVAVQPDGKILVGGTFTTLKGSGRAHIGRLNSDGTLDTSFYPGANGTVSSLALQADGKILVGGAFTTLTNASRARVGRLNSDGSIDSSLTNGANGQVWSLAVQTDGKILVGGAFTSLGGLNRTNLGRLNADGSVDPFYNPAPQGSVFSVTLQPDGKTLLGGILSSVTGRSCTNIARLNATDPAISSLTSDGSTITWLRGGTSPEIWRTTFEWSADGLTWTNLGVGSRISGGWQLTNLSLSATGTIRARGFASSGYQNGSASIAEASLGQTIITEQPASRTNTFGSSVTFFVYPGGTGPFTYQWLKNGLNLSDAGNVSGSATTHLTLTNVAGPDDGGYSVVVTGASGSVTSSVAMLTVIEPIISTQPVSQIRNAGDTVTFTVTVLGTPPLNYQWRHGGLAEAGAINSSLTLSNTQPANAGSYDVIVSNAYGSLTSSVAVLTVNSALADSWNPTNAGLVYALVPEPNGKTLVGGERLLQLNSDGSSDTNYPLVEFPSGNGINTLAVQPDGRVLVGGLFQTFQGTNLSGLARVNPDGTLDTNFYAYVGASDFVETLVVQPDGKILVGGGFYTLNGQSQLCLGRLNPDGTLDPNFTNQASSSVTSMAIQPDGKTLLVGYFTSLANSNRLYIARLNADGSLDNTFNPGANNPVYCLALQPDGKILAAGSFTTLGNQNRNYIGRLKPDGTVDSSFNPSANGNIYSMVLQADGKIIIGGNFTTVGGQTRIFLARLNTDGTTDPQFNPYPQNSINCLALQADGNVLVGGDFSSIAEQNRYGVARLLNTIPATQSLGYDGSTLTWLRGGSSPEAWRVTFEYAPDGINLTNQPGGRTTGGWQLSNLSLPDGTSVRARAYTVGGLDSGSDWFAETVSVPAVVLRQTISFTNGLSTLTLYAPSGQVVVVQASQDFQTWSPIATNTLGASPLFFTDPQSASFTRRFYRSHTQ